MFFLLTKLLTNKSPSEKTLFNFLLLQSKQNLTYQEYQPTLVQVAQDQHHQKLQKYPMWNN